MQTDDQEPQPWVETEAERRLSVCLHVLATRGTRWLAATGFTRWFKPCAIGGARPFFLPKWVPSFEQAWQGFSYELELMVGRGSILFYAGTGAALAVQFKEWSRQARGGKLELHTETGLYRFTPDRDREAWRYRLVPAPIKRLILPSSEPATQRALVLPGGAM